MAVGDAWEISLAVPVPNSRFAEWSGPVSDGPVGWYPAAAASPDIAHGGYAAQPYLTMPTGASQRIDCDCGPASISPSGVRVAPFFIFKKQASGTFAPVNYFFWRADGVGVGVSGVNVPYGQETDWTVNQGPFGTAISSGQDVSRVTIQTNGGGAQLDLSQVALRYKPDGWGSPVTVYETITSTPDPSGLYYGAMDNGKWKLSASFESLSETDYQTMRRYHLANRGGLDGIPRPVCIRPYLEDGTAGPYPEIIVGSFTSFSFQPRALGADYSGSFAIEEF